MADGEEELPEIVQARAELVGLDEDFATAFREVEKFQHQALKPVFEKRAQIISKIPSFWATALGNHPEFGAMMSHDDAELMNYLDDFLIECNDEDPWNFNVTMKFKTNPIIKNAKLVKEFTENEEGVLSTKKSTIDWHDGKNPSTKNAQDSEPSFFIEFFTGDPVQYGEVFKEFFQNAVKYYRGEDDDDDDDDDDMEEYDLGEEDSEDEEEQKIEVRAPKRSRRT